MNTLALATLLGMGVGLGATSILAGTRPTRTRLSDALEALGAGVTSAGSLPQAVPTRPTRERLGDGVGALAARWGMTTPVKDLALLNVSAASFWMERATSALVGLALPLVLSVMWFLITGSPVPLMLPAGLSLALAALFWIKVERDLAARAARARREMAVAAVAYLRLVAIRRLGSAGVTTAMESAAGVSQAWMFQRILEALMLARVSGLTPWDALRQLADRLALPELNEIADITSQAGQGAAIASHLSARAVSMRDRQLNAMVNATGTRTTLMSGPMFAMTSTLVIALMVPALASLLS